MKIVSPKDAISELKKGNERFLKNISLSDPDRADAFDSRARNLSTQKQRPYATILCCSDSRVPPELVFDEGPGQLFIVRVAGNILTPALLGSIEYASLYLTSRLIMVMGHESCGAVEAAVNFEENKGKKETFGINEIISHIMPAVLKVRKKTGLSRSSDLSRKKLVEAGVRENVKMTVKQIAAESESLRKMQNDGELKIIGGYYSINTGKVDIWA